MYKVKLTAEVNPVCFQCNKEIIREPNSISTGYGIDKEDHKICFACCGENDRKCLLETGKMYGYFSKDKDGRWYFSNWPGSFKIHAYYTRSSWHNFAGRNGRTDFWCIFEGNHYWGVQIGHNNQCATLRKVKK